MFANLADQITTANHIAHTHSVFYGQAEIDRLAVTALANFDAPHDEVLDMAAECRRDGTSATAAFFVSLQLAWRHEAREIAKRIVQLTEQDPCKGPGVEAWVREIESLRDQFLGVWSRVVGMPVTPMCVNWMKLARHLVTD